MNISSFLPFLNSQQQTLFPHALFAVLAIFVVFKVLLVVFVFKRSWRSFIVKIDSSVKRNKEDHDKFENFQHFQTLMTITLASWWSRKLFKLPRHLMKIFCPCSTNFAWLKVTGSVKLILPYFKKLKVGFVLNHNFQRYLSQFEVLTY